MDTIKNKGKSASIPVAIRFCAGDDSVEDVTKRPDSDLLKTGVTLPQPIPDESNWRIDFLQSNLFNRKRSGSAEEASVSVLGSSPSSINNDLSQESTSSGGTWKMIKGKVSQAMGDIKSSKSDANNKSESVIGDDSDHESLTINSSISDDLSDKQLKLTKKQPHNNQDTDSDSDLDLSQENESSLLRKSITSLRNRRTKQSHTTSAALQSNAGNSSTPPITTTTASTSTSTPNASPYKPSVAIANKEDTPTSITSGSGSIRKTFFRRRKKSVDGIEVTKKPAKREVEIESAVEITEEMMLNLDAADATAATTTTSTNPTDESLSLDQLSATTLDATAKRRDSIVSRDGNTDAIQYLPANSSQTYHNNNNNNVVNPLQQPHIPSKWFKIGTFVGRRKSLVAALVALIACYFADMPQFLQGVLTCLFVMMAFGTVSDVILQYLDKSIRRTLDGSYGPDTVAFQDTFSLSTMPICEIQPAEEHLPLKSYSGWMNEINSYDPANYHISMTKSVFVKLDGTILRISNTNARISKRSIWNEVEKKNVTHTKHRRYDLTDCLIEMCPKGLARKRHFSRKYPIQLIIRDNGRKISDADLDDIKCEDDAKSFEMVKSASANNEDNHTETTSEDRTEKTSKELDIGSIIMYSDLKKLQEKQDASRHNAIPCAEETRLLLFARCDREKEDWYRRFYAASTGSVHHHDLRLLDLGTNSNADDESSTTSKSTGKDAGEKDSPDDNDDKSQIQMKSDSTEQEAAACNGLLLAADAIGCPLEYVKFMARYQNLREKAPQPDHWKGVSETVFQHHDENSIWSNILVGQILYSCLNDPILVSKIQEFLQKKLSAIRLPSFMEEVTIAQVHLGSTPPLIHRISQPVLDERGSWFDADITYRGLMHMTITTKLNLLRLKKQQTHAEPVVTSAPSAPSSTNFGAIYDSNAESSGGSSSESDSPTTSNAENVADPQSFYGTSSGSSRKFLRIVDRITASNLFQSATDISYVQRAMENMSPRITLRVELKGLVGQVTVNFPPPPSDRIWLAFRGPPKLWITATPTLGDHTFDWSIVTNAIESKLCDEVYKYLVYPNMIDIIAPFLGQSTYKE